MLLKNLESAMNFTIGRSSRLRQAIDCLHVLSLSACWLSELPLTYRLMLSFLTAASWVFQRKACEADSIYLRYTATEGWAVSFDGEGYLAVTIRPTTVVGRTLTVLHFSADSGNRALVIFNDAMTANDYRGLIVKLKISGYSQGR